MNDFLDFVTDVLQPQILPAYRVDYPHGRGERYVHGAVHVSRCVIFSEIMRGWYVRELGVPAERFDAFAVRLALGWHDAGREDEGEDLWEDDSARLARRHALSLGLPAEAADRVGRLIVHTERGDGDVDAHLVQACDTIDILRCFPGRLFDRARFHFLSARDPVLSVPSVEARRIRDALIREAEAWIEETEAWQLHPRFDASPRCCEDLLDHLQSAGPRFPTLLKSLC